MISKAEDLRTAARGNPLPLSELTTHFQAAVKAEGLTTGQYLENGCHESAHLIADHVRKATTVSKVFVEGQDGNSLIVGTRGVWDRHAVAFAEARGPDGVVRNYALDPAFKPKKGGPVEPIEMHDWARKFVDTEEPFDTGGKVFDATKVAKFTFADDVQLYPPHVGDSPIDFAAGIRHIKG